MTTETTKPRTLEDVERDAWDDTCQSCNEPALRLIREAFALGAASRASPEAPSAESGFLLDAVSQALDGKEMSDFALSFPVVAEAADLAFRCKEIEDDAERKRCDRAYVADLEEEIARLRASPEAPGSELVKLLSDAREAVVTYGCQHETVCADTACREAGHEHEMSEDGWGCAEGCPCIPACKGHEPDTCERATSKREVAVRLDEKIAALSSRRASPEEGRLRPEVLAFACAMEAKLRKHDGDRGRTGWKGAHPLSLFDRLRGEVRELAEALASRSSEEVLSEAADVGNFAMMLADGVEALRAPSPPTEDEGAREEPFQHGKDCPVGKVQIEFVGCSPSLRQGRYGWRPADSAFLEVYVDGRRFHIDVGDVHDGKAQRRGLHVVTDLATVFEQTAMNAASVYLAPASSKEGGRHE